MGEGRWWGSWGEHGGGLAGAPHANHHLTLHPPFILQPHYTAFILETGRKPQGYSWKRSTVRVSGDRDHTDYDRVLVCCGHVAGVLSPVLCDVSAWGDCVRSVLSTVTVWVLGNYNLSPAHLWHTCRQGLTIFEMESTILFSLFFAEKILLWLLHFQISIDHICQPSIFIETFYSEHLHTSLTCLLQLTHFNPLSTIQQEPGAACLAWPETLDTIKLVQMSN